MALVRQQLIFSLPDCFSNQYKEQFETQDPERSQVVFMPIKFYILSKLNIIDHLFLVKTPM